MPSLECRRWTDGVDGIERASGSFVTLIEEEVRILTEQQQNISALLHLNRPILDEVAAELLQIALESADLEAIIAKHQP